MKQIFTCLFSLLASLSIIEVQAAPPTVPASNFDFYLIEGNRLIYNFTNGNGARRMIVAKAGSPVTGLPVNGVTYTANNSFGTANTLFTAPGEYVVGDGISGNHSISNLQPGTVYYFAIFEYNGTGVNTEYLMVAGRANAATVSAPTVPASAINVSAITGNGARIAFVQGNGARRLVVMRKDEPVNSDPVDLVGYSDNFNFGSGSQIGTGNYAVMANTSSAVNVRNLEPNTLYHVSIYEYNGSSGPVYLKPAVQTSFQTLAGPTIPASRISFSNIDGNRHGVSFTLGNGARRITIARKDAAVSAIPVNGVAYTGNEAFGSGSEIAPGEFVIGTGSTSSLSVTNLDPNSVYHYAVFEYDGTGTGTSYLTSNYLQGAGNTASTPVNPASNISVSAITGSQATISCTRGDGAYRIVILRETDPVDFIPTNLIRPASSTVFGTPSTMVAPGTHVVSTSTSMNFNITGLKTATRYHIAIFEYNGANNPVYLTTAATGNFTTVVEPSEPSRTISFANLEGNGVTTSMTRGNGTNRIVIARQGSAVSARPADGTIYTASENFGSGSEVLPGEFVVYNGASTSFNIRELVRSTNYHIAAFEYNVGPDGLPDYLVSSFAASNFTTQSPPTAPTSNITISAIQERQVTAQFTAGNGTYRLGVLRESSTAEATPEEYRNYTSGGYTNGTRVGAGNFAVIRTNTAIGTITNLQPGTSYTLTMYEFNGNNGPVYLLPGTSVTFTTGGVQPVPVPTQSASDAAFTNIQGNSASLVFTRGNGSRRLIVARKDLPVSFVPAENVSYTANAVFGSGAEVAPGEFVIYGDASNSVNITGLEANSEYHIAIFEYNQSGTTIYRYQSTGFHTASFSTLAAPANGPSGLQFTETGNSLTLNFTRGSGTGRLVAVREGAVIGTMPADFGAYPANARFGAGSQLEAGSYVVYSGTGTSVTVTDLVPGRTYHVSVFEFNGTTGPVYNRTAVLSGSFTPGGTLPVTWGQVTASADKEGVLVQWSTLQELNTSHFEVERSEDGINYRHKSSVAAAENSNTLLRYSFKDIDLQNGKYHYRIKQVDRNGDFAYSKILTVQYLADKGNAKASVYPNPAVNQVSLIWPANTQQADLMVTDASGRQVMARKINRGELISISSLQSGLYYFRLITNDQVYTVPLVKR